MNALAMIERCMRHNADLCGIHTDWECRSRPHPFYECDAISDAEGHVGFGPNLLLWNGRAHALVLTMKG